ncbi:MAG: hypothetical protein ABUU24_01770, partial [Variovorax sp.]
QPEPIQVLVAGATGALGNEVVRRLIGSQQFTTVTVLAREPIRAAMRGVAAWPVPTDCPAGWPAARATLGVILFEPPRMFYERERALWTPVPQQLADTAAWMRRSGVGTLAVVLPHEQGRLPEALKRGLAGLDEHQVAALGFERVLFIRSARKPRAAGSQGLMHGLASAMLAIFRYMVPHSEQPVRAVKVAELLALALELAPPGIHVAAPEQVWRAAQGPMRAEALAWLQR